MGVFVSVRIGAGNHVPSYAINQRFDSGVRGVVGQKMVDHVDARCRRDPFAGVDTFIMYRITTKLQQNYNKITTFSYHLG